MKSFNDAKDLLVYCRKQFPEFESAYNESLQTKQIRADLLISIKNTLENLRSTLDYTAYGLFQRYGFSPKKRPKVYFPYAELSESAVDFCEHKRIENCIPGITSARPDIVERIESYQCFSGKNNRWLPVLMTLCNEGKHQQLTPQVRRETKELRLSSGKAGISLGSGASISLSPGSSIQIGGMHVMGGQIIDVNNPPFTIGPGKKELITWVSFHFSDAGNTSVMPFLDQALRGSQIIVEELSAM